MSTIEDVVKDKYGQVAKGTLSSNDPGVRQIAAAFGYSPAELASIPAESNMGLSCGNPTALASLQPGEVVVDLGSGGGLDVFLAAQRVGPTGKAIGIDMTPEMIARAQKAATEGEFSNVAFHQSTIDKIPLPDASADCIISNCVINLASDKQAVFREMYRVLKPGGRVAVSDIALKQTLPPDLAQNVAAYVGCIAGAIFLDDYITGLQAAGFETVHVTDAHADLNAYASVAGQSGCCSPAMQSKTLLPIHGAPCCGTGASPESMHDGLAKLTRKYNLNDYAASVKIIAVKPK